MNQTAFWMRVLSRKKESDDVVSWRLGAEDPSSPLPRFDAGAHVDVRVGNGLVRKYSLCNDPREEGVYEIAVKLEPLSRGGSAELHENLWVGCSIQVSRPANFFPLCESGDNVVLVAAGIGITPLISMAHSLHWSGREFELHYFSRSDEAAYVSQLKSSLFSSRVNFHIGLDVSATLLALREIVFATTEHTHVYFCGPLPFMSAVKSLAGDRLPSDNIHSECFSAAPTGGLAGQVSFDVFLARAGVTLTVPANKSITDVLFENSIPIETSCEAGTCGACVVGVLDGVPYHCDEVLTVAEKEMNNKMLPCVSRSCGPRLVLDL